MEYIFHEQQEGALCAQHCLNALLQGAYFTVVDLASIAQQLDEAERERMAEGGVHSAEYARFMAEPSHNMDDSGFFSIQVLEKAVEVMKLHLVPYDSEAGKAIQDNHLLQKAFICNLDAHWLTVRKVGQQWFNLNSMLTGPELISDTFLGMFLAQLKQEGYSIFAVVGDLPPCVADQILQLTRVTQRVPPKLISDKLAKPATSGKGPSITALQLEQALAASKVDAKEEAHLRAALEASLQPSLSPDGMTRSLQATFDTRSVPGTTAGGSVERGTSTQPKELSREELRLQRQAFFDRKKGESSTSKQPEERKDKPVKNISEMSEEEMIEMALRLSEQEK